MCYFRLRTSLLSKVSTPGGGLRAWTVFRCSSMSRGISCKRASTFLKRSARVRSRLWPFGGMSTRGARTGSHSRSQPPFSGSNVPKVPSLMACFRATAASRRETSGRRHGLTWPGAVGTWRGFRAAAPCCASFFITPWDILLLHNTGGLSVGLDCLSLRAGLTCALSGRVAASVQYCRTGLQRQQAIARRLGLQLATLTH